MLKVESTVVKTEHSVVATKNILHGIFIWKNEFCLVCFVSLSDYCWGRAGVSWNRYLSNGRKGQLYCEHWEREVDAAYVFHSFLPLFAEIISSQALFAIRLSYVLYTYGIHCRRAHCCSPWAVSESLTALPDCMDNKQEIVTISHPCQKNISDMGYKQRPLITKRSHDFKQPDSSCLVGTVGAGQGNMMK